MADRQMFRVTVTVRVEPEPPIEGGRFPAEEARSFTVPEGSLLDAADLVDAARLAGHAILMDAFPHKGRPAPRAPEAEGRLVAKLREHGLCGLRIPFGPADVRCTEPVGHTGMCRGVSLSEGTEHAWRGPLEPKMRDPEVAAQRARARSRERHG